MHKIGLSFEARQCFLKAGYLSSQRDAFLGELVKLGYTRLSIEGYAMAVAHFAQWSSAKGLTLTDLSARTLAQFAKHRCRCPGGRTHRSVSRRYVNRVRSFVRYLQQQGAIVLQSEGGRSAKWAFADEFTRWLHEHRGVGAITIRHYTEQLEKLPSWFVASPARITASKVRAVVLERAPHQSGSATRCMTTAMRMYLRFLGSTGRCAPGLEGALPTVPQWRLSTLPSYLMPAQIERLIAACDLQTLLGVRDRAVLLLLARLGLRAGDISGLCLDDIDWRAARLKVCGKAHRETWLPLPQEAGDAVLDYLERRPPVPVDRVFLCICAPYRSIRSNGVSGIVSHALRSAGIHDAPSTGATLLRHSAATSMLRGGASLEAVSTMLRHRSLDMTVYYAKVDLPMLQGVVQPWPEGVSC